MLSNASILVETIHADDLTVIVGAKTWVPQNFEDSEQATHSAIPVFAENAEAYNDRLSFDVIARRSVAVAYREQIGPEDGFTKEELKNWGRSQYELLPSETRCNDGIIRPTKSLTDHPVNKKVSGFEIVIAGVDKKLIPVEA